MKPSPVVRLDFRVQPGGALGGSLRVPGDKSISHRALLLGAIARGETRITHFLESADCHATLAALTALGVATRRPEAGTVLVQGAGSDGLSTPCDVLDCGNSGTSLRLLTGLLAGQPFRAMLDGDASLRRRPMQRVIEPLSRMGARFESRAGRAPLTVHGRRPLKPLRYVLPVASAQVKTALLFAGLYAEGETWLREPGASRDHTERLLPAFGGELRREGHWLGVRGGGELQAAEVSVPGDLSSAAFFIAGAAMLPGAELLIEGVGVNPTRAGVLRILQSMGAEISLRNERRLGDEPVADLLVRGTELRGTDIAPELVPLAIDDLPALLVAAAAARGPTTLRGAQELRVKESDRLAAMAEGLGRLGVPVELWADGLRVTGVDSFAGAVVDSYGDHRIAMAFAIAGLRARAALRILDCGNVETSFPDFAATAGAVGLRIHAEPRA